jgi:hypothetical protein
LPGVYRESYWVCTVARESGTNLPEVLDRELHSLEKHELFLAEFCATGGSIEYYIGWFTETNSGVVLDWSLLKRLATLKIDLDIDVYGGPDPGEKSAPEIDEGN